VCVCVCVCVSERERERDRQTDTERQTEIERGEKWSTVHEILSSGHVAAKCLPKNDSMRRDLQNLVVRCQGQISSN
jgi:hypothetical protein